MAQASSAARKSAHAPVFHSDNVRHLCRMEVPGGGQVVIQGQYAFVGHQHGPDGTTILDISNPRDPKVVQKIMLDNPIDRKSTRLNSSHSQQSRMPSSA